MPDDRLRDDERGLRRLLLRERERGVDRRVIVAVDVLHVPPVSLEATADVFSHCHVEVAFDRDPVAVVEEDEVPETEVACERCGFCRHAFLHVAVAADPPDVRVDDRQLRLVEARREHLRGERHPHGGREAGAQRAGRELDARGVAQLRMPRRLRSPLSKALELVHRELVPREMQERIEEHRCVTAREERSDPAVRPIGLCGVETQEVVPEDECEVGRAHGQFPG